jgi:hypothetical protein
MIGEDLRIHGWKFKFIVFLYPNLDVHDYNLTRTQDLVDSWCMNLKSLKDPMDFWEGTFHNCTRHWHEFRTMITKSLEIKTMVEIKIMHEIWILEIKNWMSWMSWSQDCAMVLFSGLLVFNFVVGIQDYILDFKNFFIPTLGPVSFPRH